MSELDGVWRVERVGGLLPPLSLVRKRIDGLRGVTKVGLLPGVPFDIVGLSLRYRAPFAGFVDILEPRGDGYSGRACFLGAEFGRFRLVREA